MFDVLKGVSLMSFLICRMFTVFLRKLNRFFNRPPFLRFIYFIYFVFLLIIFSDILYLRRIVLDANSRKKLKPLSYENILVDFTIKDYEIQYEESIKMNIKYGDLGHKVNLNETEKKISKKRFEENYFDIVVSDKISLLRRLPDKRNKKCLVRKYPKSLPKFDLIITFYNEAYSTLLRTIHTALSRSPPKLLSKILLIDDNSHFSKELTQIHDGIKNLTKVKYYRLKQNNGLIKARQKGAELATEDVIIFLDSHCECFHGWVEPLLADITENQNRIITPVVITIDDKKFTISPDIEDDIYVGTLTSRIIFNWIRSNRSNNEGFTKKSPTMAGGLYAIDRINFFRLGGYDTLMTKWGGENIEFSLRAWMCGAEIYVDSCSIVGHVFRDKNPNLKIYDNVNDLRTAEVWLDEYKKHYLRKVHISELKNKITLLSRFKIKKELNCKSFKWYLENVYIGPKLFVNEYQFKHIASGKCLALSGPNTENNGVRMIKCSAEDHKQNIEYDYKSIFVHWHHLSYSSENSLTTVMHQDLNPAKEFTINDKMIYNKESNKYLKYSQEKLFLDACKDDSSLCKWNITLTASFE